VALEKSQFDLVLMDCHMPELDGFETTQEIRRRFGHSQWPYIVAVTASTMKEDVDRCVASGMNSVLSKPLTVSALVQVLKTVQRSEGSYTVSSGAELFSDKPVEANRKSSDPMDSKKFWQGFTGMESFALNLIREFLGSMSSMVSQIDEAVLSGDLKQLRMSAHALKGAVSNFAAPPSEELASQLEQCGASGDLQRAALVLERLHEEVARLRTALEGVQLEGAQNEELKRAS
jgi:CheY-like chemotaxis protein